MANVFKKVRGTSSSEFYIGLGDIEVSGQPIIGFRTNAGVAEYREAGDSWKPLASTGGFDEDTILTEDVTGDVIVDDITGNVMVNE